MMPRTPSARTSRVKVCWLVLAAGFSATPAGTAAQETPPSRIGPIWDGRQHQPAQGAVQERQREQGVAPDTTQNRDELRELNELSRPLLPPGSRVPAPGVEGQAPPAGR